MAKEPLIFATIVRNSSIKNGIASFVLKLKAIEGLIELNETIIGVLHNLILSTVKEPLHLTLQPFPSIQTHYRSLEILQHIQTAGLWKVAANAFDIPRELSTIYYGLCHGNTTG